MFKNSRYNTDTLQTRMPFWYSFRSQHSRYSTDTLQTRMPLWYSFRSQHSDTVQIRSRHGCHFVTHSNFNFKIHSRYAPDTAAILSLIQISISRYGSTIISRWHLQAHLQQLSIILPNGIFKPIPSTINHHRVQISGHSSVQSSSIFESRMAKLASLNLQV